MDGKDKSWDGKMSRKVMSEDTDLSPCLSTERIKFYSFLDSEHHDIHMTRCSIMPKTATDPNYTA